MFTLVLSALSIMILRYLLRSTKIAKLAQFITDDCTKKKPSSSFLIFFGCRISGLSKIYAAVPINLLALKGLNSLKNFDE